MDIKQQTVHWYKKKNMNCVSSLPKTNNNVEGWHRSFYKLLSSCQTIWTCIEAIQKEQCLNEIKIKQYIEGYIEASIKRKRNTFKQLVNNY